MQAIDSALGPRAPFDDEIVMGDDCSTDGTRELVLDLQKKRRERRETTIARLSSSPPTPCRSSPSR